MDYTHITNHELINLVISSHASNNTAEIENYRMEAVNRNNTELLDLIDSINYYWDVI